MIRGCCCYGSIDFMLCGTDVCTASTVVYPKSNQRKRNVKVFYRVCVCVCVCVCVNSFTLTPRNDMQDTTTIYLRSVYVHVDVFHFLKTNLEPRQGLSWPNCRSHC
jgi:hypothetical protein